ncbi:hypothetical protein HOD05_02470, partial [Candidatus Woesearchaeota archaeon]|nr:hypothetical protein [Candidatus Woesearchaeota archaeon]
IEELSKLINETMLKEGNTNCFVKGPVFDDLTDGDEKTSFSFVKMRNYQGKEKSKLVVHSGAGGKQIDTTLQYEFEGMVPCVVAGSEEITKNFVSMFFKDGPEYQLYSRPVGSITFSYKEGAWIDDENGITVADFGEKPINNQGDNMNNNGWMFTPDGKNICFFPTNIYFEADEHGIKDNFFRNPTQYAKVKLCS